MTTLKISHSSLTPDVPQLSRGVRRTVKLLIALPILAAPFVFPKLSVLLVPGGVIALIVLAMVGPKSERKWKWASHDSFGANLSPGMPDLDKSGAYTMDGMTHSRGLYSYTRVE